MLAKIWQKFLIVILVIACIVNIIIKFSKVHSYNETMNSIKTSIQRENK